jgi:DNA-binding response OmpR family regulator
MAGRRVLIVDDEPYVLHILAFKLRRAGYVAMEAASAGQARALLASSQVDCVVLDVGLETASTGFDLALEMRNDPRQCQVPIIFLTAHTEPRDARFAQGLGAVAYITKPFSLKRVLEEIARVAPA